MTVLKRKLENDFENFAKKKKSNNLSPFEEMILNLSNMNIKKRKLQSDPDNSPKKRKTEPRQENESPKKKNLCI